MTSFVVAADFGDASGEDDPAGVQDNDVIGELERELDVLLDEHDRLALALQPRDRAADLGDDERREAFGGLVHQQHARVAHQRAADREHLLLAARERAGGLGVPFVQAREQLEDTLDGPGPLDPGTQLSRDREVLAHGQGREDPPPLRNEPDALARDRFRCEAARRARRTAAIAPSRGGRNPITALMQVVLPAPLRPSSASTRPGASGRTRRAARGCRRRGR